MKEEYNFKHIGKRMPYTVPERFMDDIEQKVWESVKKELIPSCPKHDRRIGYAMLSGLVAASIALLFVLNIRSSHHQEAVDLQMLEQVFSKLSSADQDFLLTVYQDDLFINE